MCAKAENLEQEIEKFILNNPEVILESLKNYEQQKEKEQKVDNEIKVKKYFKQLNDTTNGLYMGNLDSNKTIIKFFDYNCSYCKKAYFDLEQILEKEKDIKVIYKNFPILSENSVFLAKLGVLAAEKSNKTFEEFYSMINKKKGLVNEIELSKILQKIDIDPDQLNNSTINKRVESKLKKDVDLAKNLGLRGTPAFVIGGEIIFGYVGGDELLKILN
jgi:protein-disulfide isomerase